MLTCYNLMTSINKHVDYYTKTKNMSTWLHFVTVYLTVLIFSSLGESPIFFLRSFLLIILGHSSTWNHSCASSPLPIDFNPNKWFSHKLETQLFLLCFVILSSQCDIVWFFVFVRCACNFSFWYSVRLFFCLVAMFVWFRLTYQLWSTSDSTNDKIVNDANPETWIFRLFLFCHIICRFKYVVLCY
jgi:hypothetical protein